MTSAPSVAKSRPARDRSRDGLALRLVHSVSDFAVLSAAMIRMALDLQTAATEHERRQIATRPIGPRRPA